MESKRWVFLVLGAGISALAQRNPMFPLATRGLGGHGGPLLGLTTMADRPAVVGGGLIGISTNPGFSWIGSLNFQEAELDGLEFGYGALGAEAVFRYRKRIQPMAQVQLGYGLASRDGRTGNAIVGELAALVGLRIGSGENLILGTSYREVEVHGVPGISESSLDGWNLVGRMDFGRLGSGPATLENRAATSWSYSGFFSGKWTRINGQRAWLDGGGALSTLERRIAVGIAGYRNRNALSSEGREMSLAYVGLLARYILLPLGRWQGSVSFLGGVGGAGHEAESGRTLQGMVPVIEVDALAETDVTEFLRLGLGLGFRSVPLGFHNLEPNDLGGPVLSLQLATGAF